MERKLVNTGDNLKNSVKDKYENITAETVSCMTKRELERLIKQDVWNPNLNIYKNKDKVALLYFKYLYASISKRPIPYRDSSIKDTAIQYVEFILNLKKYFEENLFSKEEVKSFGPNFLVKFRYATKLSKDKFAITDNYDLHGILNKRLTRTLSGKSFSLEDLEFEVKVMNFPEEFNPKLKFLTRKKDENGISVYSGDTLLIDKWNGSEEKLIEKLREIGKTERKNTTPSVNFKEKITLEKVIRDGKESFPINISAEEFISTFNFRGVEFGKWLNEEERQEALDLSYESFLNLAKVLNVNNRFIGLGSFGKDELGIAFGSRGSGTTDAHYILKDVVINLTKYKGAGTIAREWFNAFHDWFNYCYLEGKKYTRSPLESDIWIIYYHLCKNIAPIFKGEPALKYKEDCLEVDDCLDRAHYSMPTEMLARAFEAYVEDNLGFVNQHLVHSTLLNVDLTPWKNGDISIYPQGEERSNSNRLFKQFFNYLNLTTGVRKINLTSI